MIMNRNMIGDFDLMMEVDAIEESTFWYKIKGHTILKTEEEIMIYS